MDSSQHYTHEDVHVSRFGDTYQAYWRFPQNKYTPGFSDILRRSYSSLESLGCVVLKGKHDVLFRDLNTKTVPNATQ